MIQLKAYYGVSHVPRGSELVGNWFKFAVYFNKECSKWNAIRRMILRLKWCHAILHFLLEELHGTIKYI
jgi:hypothetical protein